MSRRERPPATTRRLGYLVGVLVNALLLYLVNAWPGWRAVPFLTPDTLQVLPLVNASIVLGLLVNLVYLVRDDPWLKALGDLATTGVGLAALARLWTVYPFDYAGADMPYDLPWDLPWDLMTRTVLVVAIAGSVLGMVVALVALVRALRPGARNGGGVDTVVGGRAGL